MIALVSFIAEQNSLQTGVTSGHVLLRCSLSRTTMYSCSSLTASSALLSALISFSIGAVCPTVTSSGSALAEGREDWNEQLTIVLDIHDSVYIETDRLARDCTHLVGKAVRVAAIRDCRKRVRPRILFLLICEHNVVGPCDLMHRYPEPTSGLPYKVLARP